VIERLKCTLKYASVLKRGLQNGVSLFRFYTSQYCRLTTQLRCTH